MELYLAGMSEKLYSQLDYNSILMSYGTQKNQIEKILFRHPDIFVDS